MTPNWARLKRMIPSWVRVAAHRDYEIVWIDRFKDAEHMGETRFQSSQIVVQKGHSAYKTVEIYIHELLHAISEEHKVGLTEAQILALEKAFRYVLRKNNVFKPKGE